MLKEFDIKGMTCSACESHVKKSVSKLNGIKKVEVMLLTNSMRVEFDESLVNSNSISDAVSKAGYSAIEKNNKKENNTNKNNIKMEKDIKDKNMKIRLTISIIFLVPIMYIAMGTMMGLPVPDILSVKKNPIINIFTQFILLLPIIYVNRDYFVNGFRKLFIGKPNMDSLIGLGSTASIVYGIIVMYILIYGVSNDLTDLVHQYRHDIYFESAATILTLITLGKFLESKSKNKTTEAIKKLIDLAPKEAIRLVNDIEETIDIEDIKVGDILVIKPGSKVPVDGIVIEGSSYVDESAVTGESIPKHKKGKDEIISASINTTGILKMKAIKVGEDTTIAQIIKLVYEASNSKAPISKLADKVSGIFVPVIIAISIISFIYWLLIIGQSLSFSISIAIAVLVISCPCALGLATPLAIMVGTGIGALKGILIKSGETLEIAHHVDTVVLDKTGTITEGKPNVIDIIVNKDTKYTKEELIENIYNIERFSEHPLGTAIKEYAENLNINKVEVLECKAILGKGIIGEINNNKIIVGSRKLLEENNIMSNFLEETYKKLVSEGKTLLYVSCNNEVMGVVSVADKVKETSKQAIKLMNNMGINTIMLTGDNKIAAEFIAKEIGIKTVISDVLPQEKDAVISKLQNQGKKVIMVGDGINDAPALARANVGIAIRKGTDIAIDSADMVLIKNDLIDVVNAIKISKEVILNIKQNLFFAFIYNICLIPIAAGVLYNAFEIKLNPMMGAAAMSLSSLFVVTNALRLRTVKLFESKKIEEKERKINMERVMIIEGMTCGHCTAHVAKALNSIEGVEAVVDLETKKATLNITKDVSDDTLKGVVEEEGYKVVSIK